MFAKIFYSLIFKLEILLIEVHIADFQTFAKHDLWTSYTTKLYRAKLNGQFVVNSVIVKFRGIEVFKISIRLNRRKK